MMGILIAILGCQSYKDNGNIQAVRDTWLPYAQKESNVDVRFFLGNGSKVEHNDEVLLDVPDDYAHVTYKTREIYKYTLNNRYEHVFKCFADTYVCPRRLITSGFEKYDYSGNFACRPTGAPAYCTGGAGYWVSRAVCEKLVGENIPTDVTVEVPRSRRPLRVGRSPSRDALIVEPKVVTNILTWAEDKWTGELIYKNPSLTTHHDTRYEEDVYASGPQLGNRVISQHLSRTRGIEGAAAYYDNKWLYAKHEQWLNSSAQPKEDIKRILVVTPTVPSRRPLLAGCKESVVQQVWDGRIVHSILEDTLKEGPSAIRNRIVKNFDPSFEWIAFVDDDDKLLPNHFSTLVENSEGADIIYSDCQDEGFKKSWVTKEFDYEEVKKANYIPVTVLMRRSLFEKVGGFTVNPPGEDQDLWLRCAKAGGRFVYVPQVTWTYHQHPQYRGY